MANTSRRLAPRQLRAGGVLFLVLGLCLPVLFVVLGLRSADQEKSWPQVEGVVVANIAHHDMGSNDRSERNKPLYRPRVDYVVDGETHTYTSTTGSRPPKYEVGEQVMISYDPDRPEVAHISGSQLTLFMLLAACFLLAFGASSIIFFFLASRVSTSRGDEVRSDVSYPAPMAPPVPKRVFWARRLVPILAPLVVGALVAAIAGQLMGNMHSFEERAVRVDGVVTQLENDQGTFHPVVTYEYRGTERTFRSPSGSKPPAYQKGEKVTLLIDPDLSSEVRIAGEGETAVKVVLAVGLALVLLGLVLGGIALIKNRAGRTPQRQ